MEGICYIVGGGEFCGSDAQILQNINQGDLIVAADAGYDNLKKYNITPSVLIGDFDSIDNTNPLSDDNEKHSFSCGNIPPLIQKLNPVKDITDMQACTDYAAALGFKSFCLMGGMGGRFDHTLANIQLMSALSVKGFKVSMYGSNNIFHVICNDKIEFGSNMSGYISVFSLSDKSTGVCESNLKYQLKDASLSNTYALGISNEFIGQRSCISVGYGILLIIINRI